MQNKQISLNLEEIKKINLQTLLYFRQVCEQYDLRYYLAFGTLLGAVRHGGFIPWDDDIDVLMPRADYERLISLAQDIDTDDYELLSYRFQPDFILPYAKMCYKKTIIEPSRFSSGFLYGLSIDIFPLDVNPCTEEIEAEKYTTELHQAIVRRERKACKRGVTTFGSISMIKRIIKKVLYRILNQRDCLLQFYRDKEYYLMKLPPEHSVYRFYYYDHDETVWRIEDFSGNADEYSSISFEGYQFTAPVDCDAVLRKCYGDYMKLPPVEKRVVSHSYKAYYIS